MMYKTKILVLGPSKSGKTTIANYLADASEVVGGEYRPTFGVRIVEFESNDLELGGRNIDAEVELWDCSGDRRFEPCWPAIQKDTHGVILVCNPENAEHIKEIEKWYAAFVHRRGVHPSRVVVFAHERPKSLGADGQPKVLGQVALPDPVKCHVKWSGECSKNESAANFVLPEKLSHLQCVTTNIEKEGEQLRLEFNNFLCTVIAAIANGQG